MAPAGAAGSVDVTVTTPAGTSATSAADCTPTSSPPTVTAVSPAAGSTLGGTLVTITGTNFSGATAVKFGATAATLFTVNSATSITAVAPAGAAGSVDVTVTTPAGPAPPRRPISTPTSVLATVTGLSPTGGPTAGGTPVTITGTNFSGATAVKFGATAATSFTVNSATSITAVAPAGAAGSVDVTVTTPAGTSATSAADNTPTSLLYVTGLNPSGGPTAGGTLVTITGANFGSVIAVTFGGGAAAITHKSDTSITVTTPITLPAKWT